MDDTSRILNHNYSEGENFPDYDDQAKWRLKVKGREWDEEFQKLKNQGDKISWLYKKMRAQSELLELSGARIMKVEDNFQRTVGGIKEELDMRPTRDQINSQLVSEKEASRSFVIKIAT
jgi:hypothetical protein